MAKQKSEELLLCPFCGSPALKPYAYIDGPNTKCSNPECELNEKNIRLNTWQKRHNPELKQVYAQFEESLKANQSKMDKMKKKADDLFHLVENELAAGRYEEGVKLAQSHAEAIKTVIALAKEYLHG